MSQTNDPAAPATNTSYSDPIYDRIDSFANRVKRQWPLFVFGIMVVTAVTVLVVVQVRSSPLAADASAYQALDGRTTTQLEQFAANAKTPVYRAIVRNQLASMHLANGDVDRARSVAQQAEIDAKTSGDVALQLRNTLHRAAIELQAGALEKAERLYNDAVNRTGALPRFAPERLEGKVMSALAAVLQNTAESRERALLILDALRDKTEPQGPELMNIAKTWYWRLLREKANAASAAATSASAATASTSALPLLSPELPSRPVTISASAASSAPGASPASAAR